MEKKLTFNRLLPVLLFCLLALAGSLWLLGHAHLSQSTASTASHDSRRDLTESFSSSANNTKSSVLDGLTYIRKIYKIPEDATFAPAPNQANFGSTRDPAVIQAVIDSASVLLEGQDVIWTPDIQLYRDEEFHYYYDETILVIAWKEVIGERCCTCVEVKVADGSQIRRKLSGDGYDSHVREYGSNLAVQANAVVAINGDFYAYRKLGVTVYQRQLYRCQLGDLDSCFVTASGDMLVKHMNDFSGEEEVRQYIEDNDVLFSLAFGPILVEDGVLQNIWTYRIGETRLNYSRAAIGQVDRLHYYLMTINYDKTIHEAATLMESATIMYERGCQVAYALDGGQTSQITMNGKILNHVDRNSERLVSDVIYFGSALPEEGGAGA